jgi:hypothetical protein
MKLNKAVKWLIFLSLATIGGLVFVVGCGNNSTPVDYLYENPEVSKLPQLLEKTGEATEVSQYLDADAGGQIEFECDGGEHEFLVAAGSMPASCTVCISAWTKLYEGDKVLRLNFAPSGLEFNPAAQLVVDVIPIWGSESNLNLYWYDPQDEEWELEEGAAVDVNGNATFHLDHFSKYAISG